MDAGTYQRALYATKAVVAGTRKEQLDDPTPCSDWSVRDLLNHVINGCLAWASGEPRVRPSRPFIRSKLREIAAGSIRDPSACGKTRPCSCHPSRFAMRSSFRDRIAALKTATVES